MTSNAPGQMRTFGIGYDSNLWWKQNQPPNDINWTGWAPLLTAGQLWIYDPVSVSRTQGETSVFVVSYIGHNLYQMNFNASAPNAVTPAKNLGGCFPGPPAVTKSRGGGIAHIFHVGTDHCLYYKSWDGANYSPGETTYEKLEGLFRDTPAAVSAKQGEVSCFAIGQVDGCLYHHHWTQESGWAKPEKLPGFWGGSLSAVCDQDGHWDVFGLDMDGKVSFVSNSKYSLSNSQWYV